MESDLCEKCEAEKKRAVELANRCGKDLPWGMIPTYTMCMDCLRKKYPEKFEECEPDNPWHLSGACGCKDETPG